MWYGDGTFSIAPVHFYQLYTIHGIVLGQLLPLVYCPLTKMSKSTYELLFETFKDVAREKNIEIKVETIRTDFEEASIKATTKVFDVGIESCFFHLCQAHWRKIQDLGLRQTYIEDSAFSMSCKMMSALVFVSVSDVYNVFSEFLRVIVTVKILDEKFLDNFF